MQVFSDLYKNVRYADKNGISKMCILVKVLNLNIGKK